MNQQLQPLAAIAGFLVSVNGDVNPTPVPAGADQVCSNGQIAIYSNNASLASSMCAELGIPAASSAPTAPKPTQSQP